MALWHHVSLLVMFEMDASSRRTRTARLLSCHCQHSWKFACHQQSQHRKGKSQPAAQLFTVTIQNRQQGILNPSQIRSTHPKAQMKRRSTERIYIP